MRVAPLTASRPMSCSGHIIEMTGKASPSVLYIGTPGFDSLAGFTRQAGGFAEIGLPTKMLNLSDLAAVPAPQVKA